MPLLFPVLLLCLLASAQAATTTYWELNTFNEFLKGKFEGVSLTRDGRLILAPKADTLFTGEQPVIWSIAAAGPVTYIATGHRGQVYRVEAGKSQLIWTAPEPEVFALAVDPKGTLFAATSPDGKIYRVGTTVTEYFNPKVKYLWSLAFAKDGSLYAATGDEGKIIRITAPNQGEVWYETGQSHVTALAFDRDGHLLAGTEPNGIIYRVTAKDKAFVLYDAPMPEIRAIVPAPDGSLYVATLGGAFGKKGAGAAAAVSSIPTGPIVSTTTTSITVTEEAARAQQGIEIKPKPEQLKPQVTPPPVAASTAPLVDYSTGLDKSAILRINPDNLVETLWSSKEENIYDIVPSGKEILFSTDKDARVYRLEADRKPTLLIETREGEATRLLNLPQGLLAATSHGAKLFHIGGQPGPTGSFESPVHDASAPTRWGRLTFRADLAANTKLILRTRSGNAAKPDKTWSDWSSPIETSGTAISSPNARYLQWKAEFTGVQGRSPQLDSVIVAYLPQNSPPVVKAVQVSSQASAVSATKTAQQSASAGAYSITVSDGGEAPSTSAGTPTQTVSRPASGILVLTWQAEDLDNDKLVYSVYFRGEEEREWKLLKKDLSELALTLDGDALADGRYLFKVVASDSPSNPPPFAREADLVSSPALIDNTPPQLTATPLRRDGTAVEFEVNAADQTSVVRRAEASIDAGPWTALAVDDGVADSLRERFLVRLPNVPPGEHLLVIRAYDTAGNSAVMKVVIR